MTTYIIRRLIQTAGVAAVLSLIFFLLARLHAATPCNVGLLTAAGCTQMLHLDEPITSQYVLWVSQLLHGNFGTSSTGVPVGSLIVAKLPPTLILVGVSLVIQQAIALPLGILAALRPYSLPDQFLTVLSYVFLSFPAFALGIVLIYIFPFKLGVFWTGHAEDVSLPYIWSGPWFQMLFHNPSLMLGDLVQHLALPAFTLVMAGIAVDSRFMRAAMLQVLHQEYIRTAKAKGLHRRSVIFKHAFRNALLPIITNLGLYLPTLIGGLVVVEAVFSWGGIGYLYWSAASQNDYPTLQALLIFSALAVLLANLFADVAYAWLDPRIRYEGGGDA